MWNSFACEVRTDAQIKSTGAPDQGEWVEVFELWFGDLQWTWHVTEMGEESSNAIGQSISVLFIDLPAFTRKLSITKRARDETGQVWLQVVNQRS